MTQTSYYRVKECLIGILQELFKMAGGLTAEVQAGTGRSAADHDGAERNNLSSILMVAPNILLE